MWLVVSYLFVCVYFLFVHFFFLFTVRRHDGHTFSSLICWSFLLCVILFVSFIASLFVFSLFCLIFFPHLFIFLYLSFFFSSSRLLRALHSFPSLPSSYLSFWLSLDYSFISSSVFCLAASRMSSAC